jgi:hypothetical protein
MRRDAKTAKDPQLRGAGLPPRSSGRLRKQKKRWGDRDPVGINSLAATNFMKKKRPASTKSQTKAPSVADAELDGVMALAARDRENSRARGQVYLKTPNVKSKLLGYDFTG